MHAHGCLSACTARCRTRSRDLLRLSAASEHISVHRARAATACAARARRAACGQKRHRGMRRHVVQHDACARGRRARGDFRACWRRTGIWTWLMGSLRMAQQCSFRGSCMRLRRDIDVHCALCTLLQQRGSGMAAAAAHDVSAAVFCLKRLLQHQLLQFSASLACAAARVLRYRGRRATASTARRLLRRAAAPCLTFISFAAAAAHPRPPRIVLLRRINVRVALMGMRSSHATLALPHTGCGLYLR